MATSGTGTDGDGGSQLTIDRGWAELSETELSVSDDLDLAECSELEVNGSAVYGLALSSVESMELEIRRSLLDGCDLSRVRVRSVIASRLTGCKLTGTDFSGTTISDTVFEGCVLRLVNLRMAKLNRVAFIDCVLDDVDAYEMEATDVGFAGSRLTSLNFDRLKAERVDLREATEVTLSTANRLSGCLVAEHQLPGLVYTLALATDINIERDEFERHDD